MNSLTINIEVVSYLIAAAGFLFLAVLVAFGRTGSRPKRYLLAATLASTVWSVAVLALPWGPAGSVVFATAEVARNLAWIAFLVVVLKLSGTSSILARRASLVFVAAGVCAIAIFSGYALPLLVSEQWILPLAKLSASAWVSFAIIGLTLLENLFRNLDASARWGLKYLIFGLGLVFAYDLILYADALLFNKVDLQLFQARGFVNLLAVPAIAIAASRATAWQVDIHVSRSAVLHSAAILGSGLYLIGMATAGLYVREFGGDWGRIFQIIFVAAAALLLIAVFTSSGLRAQLRVWISKHFFSYKYDYREEWLRFIGTIADEAHGGELRERVIRAVAAIMDCGAGGVWIHRPGDRAFIPVASWKLLGRLAAEPDDSPFVTFLSETGWVFDLDEYADDPARYRNVELPVWLNEHPRMWLVVPLIYRGALFGFIVLGEPRAARDLEWEDYDILKTVGHQVASYLAEEQALHDLSDARRLQAFNERFAFVVHDIKNSVSQLSLMLQNAKSHGDNPEFQKDMLDTVGNTVARMRTLLERFKNESQSSAAAPTPENSRRPLDAVVRDVGARWRRQKPDLALDIESVGDGVDVDADTLSTVLDHLLQNALEAAGGGGRVALRQRVVGGSVALAVEDDGPGMDPEFVRNQLFRPLDTSKAAGYGLGAYQTRQLVRQMGGRLDVASERGRGTTMTVVLPLRGHRRAPQSGNARVGTR